MSLQQMREEFQPTLKKVASSIQPKEGESSDNKENGEDTAIGGESFPQLIWMHQQHWADYVCLSAEEGLPLTLGEERTAPLVTEVQFILFKFPIFSDHPLLIPYSPFSLLLVPGAPEDLVG